MMNLFCACEDSSFQRRSYHLGQEQIWHRAQLITGCRMSRDIDAKPAQLLNQSPYFGATGSNFGGDFCATCDNGGVSHEQTYDAA